MKPRLLATARLSLPVACAISMALTIPSAFAAARTWSGGNGDWESDVQGGWNGVWTAGDTGTFNVAGTGTVTVKSAITTGNAALAFTAGNYTLQSDDTTERIITLGNTSITLGNGVTTTIGSKATLARTGTGALTFDGNSTATSTLNIDSGGKAVNGNATFTIKEATANVNTGGTIQSDSSLVVGDTTDGATLNVLGGTVNVGITNASANIVLGNTAANSPTVNLKIIGGSLGYAAAGNNTGQHGIRLGSLTAGVGVVTAIIDIEGGIVSVASFFEQKPEHLSTVNLHGGTIKALLNNPNFLAVDNIWIKSGGAIFDSNGKTITVTKDMLTDGLSTGGGLTLNDTAVTKGTLTLSGASITYTGPTLVTAGKLVVPSTHAGTGPLSAVTVSANATLGVTASGASQWQPASLTLADPCTLEFSSVQNPGTATAPLAPTAAVGTVSGVTINLNSFSGTPVAGNSYPLLGNAGSTTGYTLGTQPPGVSGILAVDGTTLVYTVQTVSDIWTGAGTDPTFWDIATTANWTGKALSNPSVGTYADGDNVLFDDTAIPASPVAVALQQAVAPGNMIFTGTKSYTVSASGAFGIGGNGSLTKNGTGTLTLGTDNRYTGDTIINAGGISITQNNALGTTASNKTIINGGTAVALVGNFVRLSDAPTGLMIDEDFELAPNATGRASIGDATANANHHIINGNITINGASNFAQIFSKTGGGSMTINGNISGSISTANQWMLLRGSSDGTIVNKVTGNIGLTGGTGLWLTYESGSVLWEIGGAGKTFSAAGGIRISNGMLRIASAAGDGYLPSSTLLDFEGNTNTGTLELNGTKQTVAGITVSGTAGGSKFITSSVAGGQLTVNNATDYDSSAKVRLTGQLGFAKEGTAKLTLSGTSTYSGDTTVSQGILSFAPATAPDQANANPNNDASTAIIAATGATLDLTFTGTDIVAKLFFGTTQQPSGIYSASSVPAGATITTASFSGSGTLTVGGFSSWIAGIFAGGATVPLGKRGPNDDPDNDGILNLVEYAVAGQDPTVANASVGTFTGGTLSFNKRTDASGLTYAIQDSTDLGVSIPWAEVTGVPPTYVNDATIISYTLTPGTPPRNFLRLQVTKN